MVKKIQTFAQMVGFVCIALLATYGLVALWGSGSPVQAAGRQAVSSAVQASAPPAEAQSPQAPETWGDATVPPVMNYQGTLRDVEGDPMTGYYTMTFRIYNDVSADTSAAVWSEQHISVTVRNGSFSTLLGNDVPLSAGLFNDRDRFIGVTVEPYDEMWPRQRFSSAPYAFHANYASRLSAADGDPLDAVVVNDNGDVGVGTANPTAKVEVGPLGSVAAYKWYGSSGRPYGVETYDNRLILADIGAKRVLEYDPAGWLQLGGGSNVGIGREAPTTKLEVAGDAKFLGWNVSLWNGNKAVTIRQDADNTFISNKANFVSNGAASNGWLVLNGSQGVQLKYGDAGPSGTQGLTLDASGNVNIAGSVTWGGHLGSFSMSGEHVWGAGDGQDWRYAAISSAANSMCFLVMVELEDIDAAGEQAGCYIRLNGTTGNWEIGAKADDDSNAYCRARCLTW